MRVGSTARGTVVDTYYATPKEFEIPYLPSDFQTLDVVHTNEELYLFDIIEYGMSAYENPEVLHKYDYPIDESAIEDLRKEMLTVSERIADVRYNAKYMKNPASIVQTYINQLHCTSVYRERELFLAQDVGMEEDELNRTLHRFNLTSVFLISGFSLLLAACFT